VSHACKQEAPSCDVPCLQADILNQINDFFGLDYGMDTKWSDLFCEPPEHLEAMRLSRLRSGSLPTSPRMGGKGGPMGVGSLAAAVAAVMQQQQHWPATGGPAKKGRSKGRSTGGAAMQRRASGTLQQLHGDLADTDSDDESFSEGDSGEFMLRNCCCWQQQQTKSCRGIAGQIDSVLQFEHHDSLKCGLA
jgi:hypothetical protein